MTHAIRIHETGGPEKMLWEEVEVGSPGEGEVRLASISSTSTTALDSTRCPVCRTCSAWRGAASSRRSVMA